MEIITQSPQETFELGQKIGLSLKGGEVLCLYGDLGAGKTTLVQGLAKGLGINQRIVSPTFIILRDYELSFGDISHLYHIDLYRLETNLENEIINLGIPEIWGKKENVVVIEWAEKIENILPPHKSIKLESLDENKRKITYDI